MQYDPDFDQKGDVRENSFNFAVEKIYGSSCFFSGNQVFKRLVNGCNTSQTGVITCDDNFDEVWDSSQKYYISAKWFYYLGTFGAPQNGPLYIYDEKQLFDSREQALSFLIENYNVSSTERTNNGAYFPSGEYHLNHGEYSQPEFKIVKLNK